MPLQPQTPILDLSYTFQVGNFTFTDFEVPERLSTLGGDQLIALKQFPGGIRTIQTFGTSAKTIQWSGLFFGANAWDRFQALDAIRQAGQQVSIGWTSYSAQGVLTKCYVTARFQSYLEYSCEFEIAIDQTTASSQPNSSNPSSETQLANAQNAVQQAANNPNTSSGFTFPSGITQQVSQLQQQLGAAQAASLGTVGGIPQTTQQSISNTISNLQQQLQPYINGSDPDAAAAAGVLNSTLTLLNQTLTPPKNLISQKTFINPNLPALASQYYGNASLWTLITQNNGLPIDPLPIGQFTLNIPAIPVINPTATNSTLFS